MNVELAERAIRVARANPDQFDMEDWMEGPAFTKDSPDSMPPCGTTACYAGWVSFLAAPVGSRVIGARVFLPDRPVPGGEFVGTYARKALGITEDQKMALFYLHGLDQVERAVQHLASNPDAGRHELVEAAYQETPDA